MRTYEDSVPYHLYWKVLNAKHHGVPQNRERVFLIGIRDDQDNKFSWPIEEHLTKRLKDILENNVDDKYFLSKKMLNYFDTRACNFNNGNINFKDEESIASTITAESRSLDISDNIIRLENVNPSGNGMNGNVYSDEGISPTLSTNKGEGIKIKSATKSGFETATDGDSINFSVPNSETRRGRVGKGVAQTLDTACNQGGMVAKVGRSEEGKKARKESMKKGKDHTPFQAKEIIFEPSDTMNCITTATTKDNLIQVGDYRTDEGFRWRKDGNSPCIMASMRDTWKEGFSRENPPIIHKDYKIRRLTPRECFRLMDFPDTFTWPVSDSQAYKQAGNSIVVNVLYKILKQLPL